MGGEQVRGVTGKVIRYSSCRKRLFLKNLKFGATVRYLKITYSTASQHIGTFGSLKNL
jgi:hypothetical protein